MSQAAFHRNLEAGVRMKNERLGKQIVDYFDRLIKADHFKPLAET
jgi:hypothetical protein